MNSGVRHHKIHILTILISTGLMIWIRNHPDSAIWTILLLGIMVNAGLFMTDRGILFISWLAMIIGILGMIMSLPPILEWIILQIKESTPTVFPFTGIQSLFYFLVTILFGAIQAFRLFQ